MRTIPRLLITPSMALFTACAATIPVVEHQAALKQQQVEYEDRLRHLEEDRRRFETASERAKEEASKTEKDLGDRIEQIEAALADKQRTLDDVTTQLVELQDAFSKASSKERSKIEAHLERERSTTAVLTSLEARFSEALKEEIASSKVVLASKDEALVVRFKDGTLFLRGSSRLSPAAKAIVDRVALAIKASLSLAVRVDVHSDAIRPQEGSEVKDTWSLTHLQGVAIVRELQHQGVDPSRLSYAAYGQFHPLASNDSPEGRADNRRVELHLVAPPAVQPAPKK